MTLIAAHTAPSTTITTTSETVAANIAPLGIVPLANAQALKISGAVTVSTGATTTALVIKLRVGNNNTTTAQVDVSETDLVSASGSFTAEFEFVDATIANLVSGYTITVTQTGATGNGTVSAVDYDVDIAIP